MLKKTIYPKLENLLNKIGGFLHKKGISPNQLTLAGLTINFLVGVLYSTGHLFWGAVFLIFAGSFDLLDGIVARLSKKVSRFGAFLDSTIDRYSDFFIFGGLAIYQIKEGNFIFFLAALGIILGSFVVSYSKARAENYIKNCEIGLFGRSERIVLLALGTLMPFILPIIIIVLLVGTHATAIQRILHTQKTLKDMAAS